jgi:hypothetical protein
MSILPSIRSSSTFRILLATSVLWSAIPLLAFGAPNNKALRNHQQKASVVH